MIEVGLRAQPGARFERVSVSDSGRLVVHVRAPAIDGRANEAVIAGLARALGLRPRQIALLRGERSREKVVRIDLPTEAELLARLGSNETAEP